MFIKWNEKKKLYQVFGNDCQVMFESPLLDECDIFINMGYHGS